MTTTQLPTGALPGPDEAGSLGGPSWLVAHRIAAAEAARATSLPSTDEEIWRYSPVGELDLGEWSLPVAQPSVNDAGAPATVHELLAVLAPSAATVVVRNGRVVLAEVGPRWADAGLRVGSLGVLDPTGNAAVGIGSVAGPASDIFGHLNEAFTPDPVLVTVPAGLEVTDPVVVIDWVDADGALVPGRLIVAVGDDAAVEVVEWQGGEDVRALCLPVTELAVSAAGRLRHTVVQERGPRTWQIGSLFAEAAQHATVLTGQVALGGHYARTATECRLVGRGAHGALTAAYLGEGDQTLDFRTVQRHDAPDTTSDLLFCGAVGDTSRSIYTGTITIAPSGRGSNANQANRNIKLDDGAWAESVPNLEIENNDVRCSHASTVGPVDLDQLFYLQSRGVPPAEAERLIVTGFFDEPLSRLGNVAVVGRVHDELARRLLERGGSDVG